MRCMNNGDWRERDGDDDDDEDVSGCARVLLIKPRRVASRSWIRTIDRCCCAAESISRSE